MIRIGKEHQLFLDDYVIETTCNIDRRVCTVEKHRDNPLIAGIEGDWNPSLFGAVIPGDTSGYDMWYTSRIGERPTGVGAQLSVNYAVSEDGIRWRKPQNGPAAAGRGKPQAVFGTGFVEHFSEMYTVLRDHDEHDPGHRYKMVFKTKQRGEPSPYQKEIFSNHRTVLSDLEHRGLRDLASHYRTMISAALYLPTQKRAAGVAYSPDGIHWGECDPFAIPAIGDLSHLTWDPYRKQYLIFARDFFLPEEIHARYGDTEWFREIFWGRAVRLYSSEDFVHWTPNEIVMHADIDDRPGDEIYSMAVFPYEGLYIGLVQMYHAFPGDNTLDVQLAVSRDAVCWHRVGNRETFLPLGGVGEWDRFNQSLASSPVMVGDELRIYYGGRTWRHPALGKPYEGADSGPIWSGIGMAAVKRDRFVCLAASFDGGWVETPDLYLPEGRLHMNTESRFGTLRVIVCDPEGRPLPGGQSRPVTEDSLDSVVEWDTITSLMEFTKGRPVRLRFELKNAKLYSFWID